MFHPSPAAGSPGLRGEPIEVVLSDGRRVRVPEGFGVDHLRRVLEVLEQTAPC